MLIHLKLQVTEQKTKEPLSVCLSVSDALMSVVANRTDHTVSTESNRDPLCLFQKAAS